jgi:lipoprotein-releasing system permease protein
VFKPFSIFVGIRYAGARRRSQLVSFISLVSMLGMTVGVALLIVVLSVMNGFDREMRTRILGLVPHISVLSYGGDQQPAWHDIEKKIMQHPQVKATAPFAQLNGMLVRGSDVEAVLIYGIDPVREANVSIINDYIEQSALNTLQDDPNRPSQSLLLGAGLAERLSIDEGASVNVMIPQQRASGRVAPKFVRLKVAALIKTGTEIDQSIALVSLQQALSLMPAHQRTQGLRITIADTFEAPRVAWELSNNIPYGFISRDWTRTHGNLYSAIQLSKQLVGLMLLTIIAVAAFNVVSALVMIVTDKQGDIAILRTLGLSPKGVMAIFMVQGTVIALIGTLLGTLIGVSLSLCITDIVALLEGLFNVQFLKSDVYPIDYLPSDLRLEDVLRVCLTAFAMSLLATVYPAWRASRVQPAEALRYQ